MKSFLPGFDQLRTRLIYLLVVALLPACGLVLYGNLEQQRLEKGALQQQAVASARLAAATQEHYVRNARHLLSTLTEFSFLTLATDRAFVQTHFQNLRLITPDYCDFGLIESNGLLFASAALTNASPSLTNTSIFKRVSSGRRFSVSLLETDTLANVPSLRFGYPVSNSARGWQRIIYASVRLPLLSHALTNLTLPPDSTVLVFDREANVLARFPDPENWVGKNVRDRPHVKDILEKGEQIIESTGLDGLERLFATTTVGDGFAPVFHVSVGIPTRTLYAEANARWMANSLALLMVALLATVSAWIFARDLFLQPIQQIVAAATRLAKGDYAARTQMPPGRSELHQLAGAFDSMAENLEKREAELRAANHEISKLNSELELRVAERTAQLEATNRELEAFSYSVSHDLRAPLRHLDGFAQILATEPVLQNDPSIQRYLSLITKSAKKMGLLIDDLLSFSRMGRKSMSRQTVDFNDLVQGAIADLKQEQEGRPIEWSVAKLPNVRGDAAMLRQVWANLISNALKYTRGRTPARIEIGSHEEGAEIVFFVRDNGTGFEMKYADKLFGVFQRLHRDEDFEGTGIGLANVRRIISRHHGRAWAEAEPDQGATIYFSLPKA